MAKTQYPHCPQVPAELSDRQAAASGDITPSPDKIFGGGRRQILKKAGGAALASLAAAQLPKKWQQPVINSVILPTHAQTSPLGNTTTMGSTTIGTSAPPTAAPTAPPTAAPTAAPAPPEPMMVTVSEDGTGVFVQFNMPLDTSSEPLTSAFSVTQTIMGAETTYAVANVQIIGDTLGLELDENAPGINALLPVFVEYDPTSAGEMPLRGAGENGGEVAEFTARFPNLI